MKANLRIRIRCFSRKHAPGHHMQEKGPYIQAQFNQREGRISSLIKIKDHYCIAYRHPAAKKKRCKNLSARKKCTRHEVKRGQIFQTLAAELHLE